MAEDHSRGGTHEQHVKAGVQSHKNTGGQHQGGSTQGGTHDQHVKAGEQSHKNNPAGSQHSEASSRGGSHM
jgi:hypothetical protein